VERRQRDIAMFPPGRVIFVRPLKVLSGKHGPGRKLEKRWDCVWVTPEQLMSEGILISKKARPRRKPAPAPPGVPPRRAVRRARCGLRCGLPCRQRRTHAMLPAGLQELPAGRGASGGRGRAQMLEDHLIQSTVLDALATSLKHHPERAPEASAKPGRRERRDLKRTARETRRANEAIMRGKLPQGAAAGAARRASQDVQR